MEASGPTTWKGLGSDYLDGGAGNDSLYGQTGDDRLDGGADTLVFGKVECRRHR